MNYKVKFVKYFPFVILLKVCNTIIDDSINIIKKELILHCILAKFLESKIQNVAKGSSI